MRRLIASTAIMATGALIAAGLTIPANAAPMRPTDRPADPPSETLLLIDTSTGGSEHPIVGASIEVLNPAGKVMARGASNDNGAAMLRHRALPPAFTVRVSGGTIDGRPNPAVLEAAGQHGQADPVNLVHVDPITTVAMHLERLHGGHPEQNLAAVRKALGFPEWLRQSQITNGTDVIDRAELQEFVDAHGGLHDSLKHLAFKIDAGHSDLPELFGRELTASLPVAGPPTPTDDSNVAQEDPADSSGNNGNGQGGGKPADTGKPVDTTTGKGAGSIKGGGPVAGLPSAKNYREDIETSVGLYLIGSVVTGVSSSAGSAILGSVFGTGQPTADELTSIDTELQAIDDALVDIENELNNLTAITQQETLQDIVGDMSDIEGNTQTAWDSYDTFLETKPWLKNNDYDASVLSYANWFDKLLTPNMGEWSKLFSNTKNGYIGYFEQLYSMEASNAAWYTQTDIEHLQAAVDYYGTLQAQSVALTTEAWQTPGSTAYLTTSVVQTNLTGLTKQNSDIYKSWPTDIGDNEVVVPGSQRAYSLSRYINTSDSSVPGMQHKVSRHVQYTANPTNHYKEWVDSCGQGAYYEGSSHLNNPDAVSDTTMRNWWLTAVPSGYTIADTSDFGPLSQPRGSAYSTSVLKPSGSNYEVMVTKNSIVGASQAIYRGITVFDNDYWEFKGWLWCHDYTVDLTATTSSSSNWDVNHYYGSNYSDTHNFKVGVLVSRPGSWRYVQPS